MHRAWTSNDWSYWNHSAWTLNNWSQCSNPAWALNSWRKYHPWANSQSIWVWRAISTKQLHSKHTKPQSAIWRPSITNLTQLITNLNKQLHVGPSFKLTTYPHYPHWSRTLNCRFEISWNERYCRSSPAVTVLNTVNPIYITGRWITVTHNSKSTTHLTKLHPFLTRVIKHTYSPINCSINSPIITSHWSLTHSIRNNWTQLCVRKPLATIYITITSTNITLTPTNITIALNTINITKAITYTVTISNRSLNYWNNSTNLRGKRLKASRAREKTLIIINQVCAKKTSQRKTI